MQEIKTAIIETMKEWNKDLPKDCLGVWKKYKKLSKETGYDIKDLKKAMKELLNEGRVEVLHTSNGNSRVAGRGLFLTDK